MIRWCCVAVVLCVAACSALEDLPWWKTAILYQLYPRSFKDSDGDGVGDLKGILQMADYFKEAGLDAVWLCPIFKSPMADFGYDVADFTAIDPLFGTMDDFDALVKKMKEIGVKLLLDFVPNHTSDEHEWFQKSVNNESDYSDFYIWKDPKGWMNGTPVPPNNWLSMFGGSMWEWREERQQFYLHQFSVKQPDLNFRSAKVMGNMTEVLQFWMDKGVDGFRMDAIKYIYENASFPDTIPLPGTPGNSFIYQLHTYSEDQPETYDLVKYWANYTYQKNIEEGQQRALFVEVYDTLETVVRYYEDIDGSLVVPFNFNMTRNLDQSSRSVEFKQTLDSWMDAMPQGQVANWVLGNHDNLRVPDHFGPEMVDSMNLMTLVLPGVKVTYYGEEIGMQDTYVRPDQTVDKHGVAMGQFFTRDPARTPMQWDDSFNSGFSNNSTPWLPVNPNYWWLNVAAQRNAETSHLKVFQAMAQARKDPVLQRGDYKVLAPNNDTLLVIRKYNGSSVLLVINMGSEVSTFTSQNLFSPNDLDMDMRVDIGSMNSGYSAGTLLKRGSISVTLKPKAAVVFRSSNSSVTQRLSILALLFIIVSFCLR